MDFLRIMKNRSEMYEKFKESLVKGLTLKNNSLRKELCSLHHPGKQKDSQDVLASLFWSNTVVDMGVDKDPFCCYIVDSKHSSIVRKP